MTGPEHYREAEKRIEASDWQRCNTPEDEGLECAMQEAALAQVHATLALAAAMGAMFIAEADAGSSYDTPRTATTKQVADWKAVTA